jgi:hypothetical protein
LENLNACKDINVNLKTEIETDINTEINDKYVLFELSNNSSFYSFMKFLMELEKSKDILDPKN